MNGKIIYVVLAVFFLLSFTGCATAHMPLSRVPNAEVLGEATADFESSDRTGVGVIGGTGIAFASTGTALLVASFHSDDPGAQAATGGTMIGVGLGMALIQDLLIMAPRRARLRNDARDALIADARQRYGEDIDVRDIRFTRVQSSGGTHSYNATGIVIRR